MHRTKKEKKNYANKADTVNNFIHFQDHSNFVQNNERSVKYVYQ